MPKNCLQQPCTPLAWAFSAALYPSPARKPSAVQETPRRGVLAGALSPSADRRLHDRTNAARKEIPNKHPPGNPEGTPGEMAYTAINPVLEVKFLVPRLI